MSRSTTVAAVLLASLAVWLGAAPGARASHSQEAMFMETPGLLTDPTATIAQLRLLGVDRVRLFLGWYRIAPQPTSRRRPRNFNAADPNAYPAANWAPFDRAIELASDNQIGLDIDVGGLAPLWATGPNPPKDGKLHLQWEPSARDYGLFVKAVATRYGGNYDPKTHRLDPGNADDLPAVTFWSVWNEPDYGPSLAPQGRPGNLKIEFAPLLYRNLLDAAWTSLHQTGHGADTILFGELAPRGFPNPEQPRAQFGVFSGMKPLVFLRALYCVDSHYRPLRGSAAALRGCPTTAAGSRAFRGRHPALFQATGFSDHPYSRWYPPNVEAHPDRDYSTLAEIGQLERALDRLQRVYGSSTRFPIWNTEYGYLTDPPKHPNKKDPNPWVSTTTAAYYLNWAEYISWRDPRISSTMQYLLGDPLPNLGIANDYGGFASGLIAFNGTPKPTYAAYRLPIYLPVTKGPVGTSLEVWGCARPAHSIQLATGDPEIVDIQWQPSAGGAFKTLETLLVDDAHGYFDTRVQFPGSGRVRLQWSYPPTDPTAQPDPVNSRLVQITMR